MGHPLAMFNHNTKLEDPWAMSFPKLLIGQDLSIDGPTDRNQLTNMCKAKGA